MEDTVNIIDPSMTIVRVNEYIGFDYDTQWGGGTEIIKLSSIVNITTKYNKVIVGKLLYFKESFEEGKQDYLVIGLENGTTEVGIHDIKTLECEEYARVV